MALLLLDSEFVLIQELRESKFKTKKSKENTDIIFSVKY